ncbi:MAG: flagellar protein export ATPase FliI [Pseudomonadales bacterium]
MADVGIAAPEPARSARWAARLRRDESHVEEAGRLVVEGALRRMVGLTLEAVGCEAPIGTYCEVIRPDGSRVDAEVVGFADDRIFLMPTGHIRGMVSNARVIPRLKPASVCVGESLLGRVIDGAGLPIDGLGRIDCDERRVLHGTPINPLERQPVDKPLDVGVRSINALLSLGRGQRVGLFAGSGVGKSVLLGMMTRHTSADVVVVGLVGERGREVQEFVDSALGEQGMSRAVVVATPSDHPPLMRIHGALIATSIAEYFRDQGRHVLLLMDSLTRIAQAQREIALAIGEPPVTKGYPPSVFAALPELTERAGNGTAGQGSITAIYTVLTEGDDANDPVADAARSILDGHIVLSRKLAGAGVFPAVDVEASASRVMNQITTARHQQLARAYRQIYATYTENQDLINVGAYSAGSDPEIDRAVRLWPRLRAFLMQALDQPSRMAESLAALEALFTESPADGDG